MGTDEPHARGSRCSGALLIAQAVSEGEQPLPFAGASVPAVRRLEFVTGAAFAPVAAQALEVGAAEAVDELHVVGEHDQPLRCRSAGRSRPAGRRRPGARRRSPPGSGPYRRARRSAGSPAAARTALRDHRRPAALSAARSRRRRAGLEHVGTGVRWSRNAAKACSARLSARPLCLLIAFHPSVLAASSGCSTSARPDVEHVGQAEQATVGLHRLPAQPVVVGHLDARAQRWRELAGRFALELAAGVAGEGEQQHARVAGRARRRACRPGGRRDRSCRCRVARRRADGDRGRLGPRRAPHQAVRSPFIMPISVPFGSNPTRPRSPVG